MALQLTYTDVHGTTHPNAYLRISEVRLRHAGGVEIFGHIYANAQAAATPNDYQPVGSLSLWDISADDYATFFHPDVLSQGGINPVAQAYRWIKAPLPPLDASETAHLDPGRQLIAQRRKLQEAGLADV